MDELVNLFGIREPYKGELSYFSANPQVAGMATEDNKIILNPYSKLSPEELKAVAQNEALRLFMRTNNIVPDFELTKEQQKFFKGTEYEKSPEEAKKSIVARILTGDPSVQAASTDQVKFAQMIKSMLPTMQYEDILGSSVE